MSKDKEEQVYGRNAILEVLKAGRRSVYTIRIAEGATIKGTLLTIMKMAEAADIHVDRVPSQELDIEFKRHQGIAASVSPYPYSEFREILRKISTTESPPLLLILDSIQDPQNLGALLRSAEAFGVAAVILPLRRTVGITNVVVRASSGACEHLEIVRHNLAQAIGVLKEGGFWIAGLENDPTGISVSEIEAEGPLALVVGSEGTGMRRLVRESCDYLVRIPIFGSVDSLNASVAGSIALFVLSRGN